MGGNAAISSPWDDIRHYRAPIVRRLIPRHAEVLWRRRRDYLVPRLPQIQQLCAERDTVVRWPWVAAILWDELARRDITESLTDWALGQFGRDPSVGPFQVTGGTGREVATFLRERAGWADAVADLPLPEMRVRLLRFEFAARIVIGRCEQILETWREAGHDALASDGLGPHRVSPIALVGTLYSQGLGQPKPNPRANDRGVQIEAFAVQIEHLGNC